MYNLKCKKQYDMQLQSDVLSDRYYKIFNSNKKNVVYIKDVFDNSTYRYRGYNIIQTMLKSEKYTVEGFLVEELSLVYSLIDKIDIVILQRAKWTLELFDFVKYIKKMKKIVIYDMDDMIYDTKYVPEYLNSVGMYDDFSINSFFALAKRYELMIKECDGVIATTPALCDIIKKDLNIPTWQLNNYLNKEQISVSQEICELKTNMKYDDKFVIGYFSGSNSHLRDLEVAQSGIIKFLKKYDNVYFKIVGYMNLSDELLDLKKQGKIIFSKFVSYEELQYEIGKVDLNIIPLQQHQFNKCKSELKYFEASIVKTLSLATNNEVYSSIIVDGKDGFLASELEWFDKLEYIYNNYSKLSNIIDNACKKCHEIYDYDKQEEKITLIYDDIIMKLGDKK